MATLPRHPGKTPEAEVILSPTQAQAGEPSCGLLPG